MTHKMTLWHNPRCTKSRQTLALLQDAGHEPEVRLYLVDTPSKDEVIAVQTALGVPAAAMMRKGEKIFRELGLKDADEATLIDAMVAHPILIERPIRLIEDRAAIGRPPETVLELL